MKYEDQIAQSSSSRYSFIYCTTERFGQIIRQPTNPYKKTETYEESSPITNSEYVFLNLSFYSEVEW
jgi:hypothetical protein